MPSDLLQNTKIVTVKTRGRREPGHGEEEVASPWLMIWQYSKAA